MKWVFKRIACTIHAHLALQGKRGCLYSIGRPGAVVFLFLACVGIMPLGAEEVDSSAFSRSMIPFLISILSLSLGPIALLMTTCFTRFVIVFSFLRTAMGLQQAPPNMVILGLSFFLTGFTMESTLKQGYQEAIVPYMEGRINEQQGWDALKAPFHTFMADHVGKKELLLLYDLSKKNPPSSKEEVPFFLLVPAFVLSELRHGFEIGFLISLPFIVIDLVVASVLMALGMMMLSPSIISLPFKIIFFVLIDGWSMLAASLVKGYTP